MEKMLLLRKYHDELTTLHLQALELDSLVKKCHRQYFYRTGFYWDEPSLDDA